MNKKYNRTLNFIMIIGGGLTALFAQTDNANNQYLIIGGVVVLMIGIYRSSRNIPNKEQIIEEKKESILDQSFNESELDDPNHLNDQENPKKL